MTVDELQQALVDPAAIAAVVGGYEHPYGIGVTLMDDGSAGVYLRIRDAIDHIREADIGVTVRVRVDGDLGSTQPAALGQFEKAALFTRLHRRKLAIERDLKGFFEDLVTDVPEREAQRPLRCGLDIQNFSEDERRNRIIGGRPMSGSLACFVTLAEGGVAMLSAAHVLAGPNSGKPGEDDIQQPAQSYTAGPRAATLTRFVRLEASPDTARPHLGDVTYNDVDAAVASLGGVEYRQEYLPGRPELTLAGAGSPMLGDPVRKVGRTTGARDGVISVVGYTTAMRLPEIGRVWFRNAFIVEPTGDSRFAAEGDSGALIVNTDSREAVGLLFGIDGARGVGCPLVPALRKLRCDL